MTPEKLHLALNHIPLIGAAAAVLPIVLGYTLKNRQLLMVGLLTAAISSWFTPLIMSTGEAAEVRYEHGPIEHYLDEEVHEYLELHEQRAHFWSKFMYVNAMLSSIALGLTAIRSRWERPLAVIALISCLLTIASAIWVADSGAQIRRVDFRTSSSN